MARSRMVLGAVAIAIVVAQLGTRAPAHAADLNCPDFASQAAAQKFFDEHGGSPANNVDGLDGDNDGIACESDPCPCAKPGSTSGKPSPASPSPSRLGRSVTLHRVTRHTGCRVRGSLPDPGCTPGAYYSKVTRARVCTGGYARQVRNVSQATKDAIYTAYGISTHFNGASGEVDHLVSLELGGSNVRANLFPESAAPKPGSHEKDRLENRLHAEVCSGRLSLRSAQREIASDWVAAYHHEFG